MHISQDNQITRIHFGGDMKNCFIALIVFVSILFISSSSSATNGHFATLSEFSGEVMIKNAGTWTTPEIDMLLYSGSKIVTKEGTALVAFKDGATMFVDAFSSIRTIDQIQKNSSGSGAPVRIRKIRVILGRTKYDEQPMADRKTRIELPTAVAALRGTGGWFGADENMDSAGQLYDGNMDVYGDLQDIVPMILNLARALNSPTFMASLASSDSPDNPLANVREVQSEMTTFAANADPAVKNAIAAAISIITPVIRGIEQKLETVKNAEAGKAASDRIIAQGPTVQVEVANQIASDSAAAYIDATRESMNADFVLVLEALKGDESGMAAAQMVKAQNDSALNIAGNAMTMSSQAVEMVSVATTDIQLETAMAVVKTAQNTVNTASNNIKTANTGAWLTARNNDEGAAKAIALSETTAQGMSTAQKAGELSQKALDSVTADENSTLALAVAQAAQTSSASAQNTAQIGSQAATAIQENAPSATELIQATETAVESTQTTEDAVETLNNAIDTNNSSSVQDATDTINQSATETQQIETETQLIDTSGPETTETSGEGETTDDGTNGETPEEPEAFEPAADTPPADTPVEPEAPEQPPTQDDTEPASPV
jgi:hypothetical protein